MGGERWRPWRALRRGARLPRVSDGALIRVEPRAALAGEERHPDLAVAREDGGGRRAKVAQERALPLDLVPPAWLGRRLREVEDDAVPLLRRVAAAQLTRVDAKVASRTRCAHSRQRLRGARIPLVQLHLLLEGGRGDLDGAALRGTERGRVAEIGLAAQQHARWARERLDAEVEQRGEPDQHGR